MEITANNIYSRQLFKEDKYFYGLNLYIIAITGTFMRFLKYYAVIVKN